MITTRHSTLYALSGIIWLAIGMMLLNLGLGFIMQCYTGQEGCSSLFLWISAKLGGCDTTALAYIALGISTGFMKGRFVLQKAALRSQERIEKLENPTSISNLYTRSNIIIIAGMMGLGMLMKALHLPNDIRGFIDTAVGCALIQGSLAYFRLMFQSQKAIDN